MAEVVVDLSEEVEVEEVEVEVVMVPYRSTLHLLHGSRLR
jgi:hypothetical protein